VHYDNYISQCLCCNSDKLYEFYKIKELPIESLQLFEDSQSALSVPRLSFIMTLCEDCGFIFNRCHNAIVKKSTTSYHENQAFSPKYREFCENLAARLINKYNLSGKKILEIGCGSGFFISLICEMGKNKGLGIDPALDPLQSDHEDDVGVEFKNDYYAETHHEYVVDSIICRHTLEHVIDPRNLSDLIFRHASKDDAVVCIEVPDSLRILEENAFWDIYYEHCCYFTSGTLARLFRSIGYEIVDLRKDFGEQYILLEASGAPAPVNGPFPIEEPLSQLYRQVRSFEAEVESARRVWRRIIKSHADLGHNVVLWGSSSKGAAFAAAIDCIKELPYIVNINPSQHGRYVAGTGQKMISPLALRELAPHLVINMNALYQQEIMADLRTLNLGCDLRSISEKDRVLRAGQVMDLGSA